MILRLVSRLRGHIARLRLRHGARDQPLRVHLGCGNDIRRGWLNVDMSPPAVARRTARAARDGTRLVVLDLRNGLPLPPGSCDLIYSSHFLEHLEFPDGLRLLRDCHRSLREGGRLRIVVPNFGRIFQAYVEGDEGYFDLIDIDAAFPYNEPGMEALIDHVHYAVYQHGEHRSIYDEEKLVRTLGTIGFRDARAVGFDPTLDPDTAVRRRYSLCVEARR